MQRGTTLALPRQTLPPLAEDEYYNFQLVGLTVEEEGGRVLGQVKDVLDYPANDVLELDSGVFLPLVELTLFILHQFPGREAAVGRRRMGVEVYRAGHGSDS